MDKLGEGSDSDGQSDVTPTVFTKDFPLQKPTSSCFLSNAMFPQTPKIQFLYNRWFMGVRSPVLLAEDFQVTIPGESYHL